MKENIQKKVFAIICVAIFIIAFSISVTYYIENKDNNLKSIPTGVETIEGQIEDGDNTSSDDEGSTESDQPATQVKTYNNGYACITDAFKLVSSEPGIKLTSTITANAEVLGVVSTQRVKSIMIHSQNGFLKETWAACSVSLGQNFYRYMYSNDNLQNIELRKTTSATFGGEPNWNSTTINTITNRDGILANYDPICFDYFDFIPNKKNSKLVRFDRTSNKNYYIISFAFDLKCVNPAYTQNTINEGGLSSMSYKSVTTTYYVEKSTLYIRKCENDLTYSMTKGVTVDVTMHQDVFVNSIGKAINVQKPSYCYLG